MQDFFKKKYKLIIGLILGFVFIVSILNAYNDALIYDEDAHIPAGYSYLTQHDIRLNPEHPPLLKDLAAIPLLFLQPKFDIAQDFWNKDPNTAQWGAGTYFLYTSGNNPDQIIFWSRLPIILLSLVFGLFIFKWTREMAGITAGLFALTLYAFDPNILGHNHFVTTDLGIAAFITFAFYYFIKFIKQPSGKNILLAGLFLGLVQLVKFSSVLTFPVLGLLIIIYPLVKLGHNKSKWKVLGEYIWKGAVVFIISIVVVYIGYYLNTYDMPREKLPEIMSYYLHPDDSRPLTIYARKVILSINDIHGLEPLADYTFGIIRVFQRVGGGNTVYFMQQINNIGFLSYFPIIFIIKEPLPILFFLIFSLWISLFGIAKSIATETKKIAHNLVHYLRTSVTEFAMLVFIFIYALTSITGRLNIGLRHLFPIFPFMYILIAVGIFRFIKTRHNHSKHLFHWAISLLTLLLVAETIFAYPYYMSYFNQLAGGSKQGYQLATDSNADWGQDLKRLKIFLDNHSEIANIRIDYFGGGYHTKQEDVLYYIGDKYIPWGDNKRPIEAGWYAISTNFLQSSIYNQKKKDTESYRWLLNKKPAYQVGTSILIYNVTRDEAMNLK